MIRIVGDVNITDGYFDVGYGIGSRLMNGYNPFSQIDKKDDYWIGNFEGVCSRKSCLEGVSSRQFRIEPQLIKPIVNQFNAMGLANNHSMQHGAEAFQETEKKLHDCGISVFGTILNKTTRFSYRGLNFTITGLSQRIDQFSENPAYWHNPELSEIKKEIDSQPSDSFKIIFLHWGNEYINRPSTEQILFAHYLIDIGADLIVGMHPHVLQGYEVYKGKYIFYSIGNFCFDMPWEATKYGAIVNVDISEGDVVVMPSYIKINNDFQPVEVEEGSIPIEYRFSDLNKRIQLTSNGETYFYEVNRYYRQYRKANHKDIAHKMLSHPRISFYIIKDFIKRRFL